MAKRLVECNVKDSELKKEVKDVLNMTIKEIDLATASQLVMQDSGLQMFFTMGVRSVLLETKKIKATHIEVDKILFKIFKEEEEKGGEENER